MPDLFRFSPEMRLYFQTLPEQAQRTIMQSNLKLSSLEDLRYYAEQLGGQRHDQ